MLTFIYRDMGGGFQKKRKTVEMDQQGGKAAHWGESVRGGSPPVAGGPPTGTFQCLGFKWWLLVHSGADQED